MNQAASGRLSGSAPADRRNGRFLPPKVPDGAVARPRLLHRLDEGMSRGMVLVTGPAGSGKTLLLAAWADATRTTPAWLTVEPEDAEPERFWTRVLQALQASPALRPDDALAGLHAPPTYDPRFVRVLLEACQASREPLVLVVEDLHLLTGTPTMASLGDAVRRGLGTLRLLVSSRAEPTLPLQRLRLRGELTEIHADDLSFDATETVALLGQYDLHLRPHQLQILLGRTEGWAAGVRLAALALATRTDLDEAVAELAGDHRSVGDFFVEEVLDQLPRPLVEFLLDTSVPRRVCADLANALTGRTDAQEVLDDLERRNLFVVALDDHRQWYRYHHLFADLLRHRLGAVPGVRERELHKIAASWFAEHGDPLAATRHLADAGAWGDLARYATRAAGASILGVDRYAVAEVLERVPDELVLRDAEVATAAALASYARYDVVALRAHLKEAHSRLHELHGPAEAATSATLMLLEAVACWLSGDVECQVAAAETAHAQLGRLSPAAFPAVATYRSGAGLMLGIGRLWSGAFEEAEEVLTATLRTVQGHGMAAPVLAVQLHGHLAILRSFQGRLREAAAEAAAARSVVERSGWLFLPQASMALLAEAVVALLQAKEDDCAAALDRCRTALGERDDRYTASAVALVQVRLLAAEGRPAAAKAALQELRRSRGATGPRPRFLDRWAELVSLEVALASDDADDRDRLVHRLDAGWDGVRPEADRLVLQARARLQANQPDAALATLAPLLVTEPADLVPQIEVWVVAALAHDRRRADAEALACLERALALAEPEGVARPFLLAGERMVALLERDQQVHSTHQPFAHGLLARLRGPGADADSGSVALLERLTNREQSVLQLLPTMMSNGEIAEELFVSVNTVKVHLKSLYRKPRGQQPPPGSGAGPPARPGRRGAARRAALTGPQRGRGRRESSGSSQAASGSASTSSALTSRVSGTASSAPSGPSTSAQNTSERKVSVSGQAHHVADVLRLDHRLDHEVGHE